MGRLFVVKEESQTEGGFKGNLVQRNSVLVVLMHMPARRAVLHPGLVRKLHVHTTASSHTAAPFTSMTSSEPHSGKETAVSTSTFILLPPVWRRAFRWRVAGSSDLPVAADGPTPRLQPPLCLPTWHRSLAKTDISRSFQKSNY